MMGCDGILRERRMGRVRCGSHPAATLDDALARSGLLSLPGALREVGAEAAAAILSALLWKDMAYGFEMMPEARAWELARAFVDDHPAGTRFFTNADWSAYLRGKPRAFSFTNLTAAPFDGGVLALGGAVASCVWFEDED